MAHRAYLFQPKDIQRYMLDGGKVKDMVGASALAGRLCRISSAVANSGGGIVPKRSEQGQQRHEVFISAGRHVSPSLRSMGGRRSKLARA